MNSERLAHLRQANGKRLLRSYSCADWGELANHLYRYTTCHASLGVVFAGAGPAGPDLVRVPIHLMCYDDTSWPLQLVLDAVVQGGCGTTDTVIVDLDAPWRAARALRAAIDRVEEQAEEIWQRTHGCWSCARLRGAAYVPGETPVMKGCTHCFGDGCIL